MARRQPKLPMLPKGVYKVKSGHLRYHAPTALRGEYVHRKVVKDMLAETPYSIKLLLPYPYEVHHMDYNKEHNCGCNLLMVSESLHSVMTVDKAPRHDDGRFGRKFVPAWKPAPQYVLDLMEQMENEVPF